MGRAGRTTIGALVLGLTVLAFALRVAGIKQGLFGDELFTRDDTRNGLSGVFDGISRNEVNPPLYYLLAWGGAKLGDPSTSIRLPSLLFGTATVPLVYLLGRRTVGASAGLVGACVVTLSPFAIFYSDEARAYATAAFLVVLSSLALLTALERRRTGWWIAYTVAACLALYTHYTTIFVLVAQAGWAVWTSRDQLRALLVAHAAIALGYLPWLPSLLDQRGKELKVAIIGARSSLTPGTVFEFPARALTGHPVVGLASIPGNLALALLAIVAAAVGIAGLVRVQRAARRRQLAVSSRSALILILALATPLGLLVYAAAGPNLYGPRNLSASMPAMAIAVGWLLVSLRPRALAIAATAVALAAVGIGTAKGVDDDYQRPASPDLAHYIDDRAAPGDSVASAIGHDVFFPRLDDYFERDHPVFRLGVDDNAAWRRAERGASVFLVIPQAGPFRRLPRFAGPGGRFVLRDQRVFPGLVGVAVGRYSGTARFRFTKRAGRERIVVSPGRDIDVQPDALTGTVDGFSASNGQVALTGWAADVKRRRTADLVLGFSGGRLFAVSLFELAREDVADTYGEALRRSGFVLAVSTAHPDRLFAPSRLRVIAAIGGRGSEIKMTEQTRESLPGAR